MSFPCRVDSDDLPELVLDTGRFSDSSVQLTCPRVSCSSPGQVRDTVMLFTHDVAVTSVRKPASSHSSTTDTPVQYPGVSSKGHRSTSAKTSCETPDTTDSSSSRISSRNIRAYCWPLPEGAIFIEDYRCRKRPIARMEGSLSVKANS